MAKAWPGDIELSFSGTGLTATQTKLIGFPEAPRTRNADPTKNLASSSDKRAITSGCCAVAVVSSAANAMVGNPAVADAAAIIVLNSRKPRREIPMVAPPDVRSWASANRERMSLAGVKVNRKMVVS